MMWTWHEALWRLASKKPNRNVFDVAQKIICVQHKKIKTMYQIQITAIIIDFN